MSGRIMMRCLPPFWVLILCRHQFCSLLTAQFQTLSFRAFIDRKFKVVKISLAFFVVVVPLVRASKIRPKSEADNRPYSVYLRLQISLVCCFF